MAIYKQISKTIRQVTIDNPKTPAKKLTWIDINYAGRNEIEFLRKKYNFSLLHLQSSSYKIKAQRPTIEKTKDYIFIIIHFPVLHEGNIIPGEIEFFIGKDYIVTIHNNNIKTLNQFFSLYKKDLNSFLSYEYESSGVLLYEIMDRLIQDCYYLLDQNSIAINKVEELIFSGEAKDAVSHILSLRRNIINTRKILMNHKNIIKKMEHSETGIVPEEDVRKLYKQLLEHSKRIWENFEIQKEMIEVLNSTNESFLNDRISDIMKTLTIFSVIVFPLTLFASMFGMNVVSGMPFIDSENGFWIIIAIMLVCSLGMLLFFERKKWL